MKKLFITTSVVTCVILLATGCATVKENENAEEKEKNSIVIDYETFQKTAEFNHLGDTIWSYEGDEAAILNHILGYDNLSLEEIRTLHKNGANENCKSKISVFPNPTSNFVTLDFDFWKSFGDPPKNASPIYFRYNLIFDQKIIYENDIPNYKAQIVIPEHLLQKEEVYVIAYEFYSEKSSNCQNTISFMVVKSR